MGSSLTLLWQIGSALWQQCTSMLNFHAQLPHTVIMRHILVRKHCSASSFCFSLHHCSLLLQAWQRLQARWAAHRGRGRRPSLQRMSMSRSRAAQRRRMQMKVLDSLQMVKATVQSAP